MTTFIHIPATIHHNEGFMPEVIVQYNFKAINEVMFLGWPHHTDLSNNLHSDALAIFRITYKISKPCLQ